MTLEGQYVSISVQDEGVGISPDKLSKIFEPFYTTKRTGEGTGLGLSTVYDIVKQSGEFIFAHSASGQGTRFDILFPHGDVSVVKVAKRKSQITTMGHKAKGVILLLEDAIQQCAHLPHGP